MIRRDLYLEQLMEFVDKPFVKVITGIRRSGKSVLLMLLKKELLDKGVAEKNIIYLNFESFEYSDLVEARHLYEYLKNKIGKKGKYYIILDEIQEVEHWEKAINSIQVDFDTDIYITGSNSRMLSGELATYLAGRYIGIRVHPLSFSEYLDFRKVLGKKDTNRYEAFERFLRLGGFPAIHTASYPEESAYKMTEQNTINREYKPLLAIRDNYPKYVLTTDVQWHDTIEGIQHLHIADFLLLNNY